MLYVVVTIEPGYVMDRERAQWQAMKHVVPLHQTSNTSNLSPLCQRVDNQWQTNGNKNIIIDNKINRIWKEVMKAGKDNPYNLLMT